MAKRRIGIVGYGFIGSYLFEKLKNFDKYEVCFVWNRTVDKMRGAIPVDLILEDLAQAHTRSPDLIIEVAHPCITTNYGAYFLQHADYMIGSPTILADPAVENIICKTPYPHGVYVPVGAMWGAHDIRKMADMGTLKALKVTMKKYPSSFKVLGYVAENLKTVKDEQVVIAEAPVRELCPLAPNNVNTMAIAALAAHNLGFDGVTGCLIADPHSTVHDITVEVTGPAVDGDNFAVLTRRSSPTSPGMVTSTATQDSFYSSMTMACGKGPGVHIC
ncbi:aspartate dehydrogenase domain-containing protein-like [Dysidea avara]|uniref:aspartate dehydrogenase domain-containing protein-like n=1 Tax=Dysidea avara TaxID=196820 RepID=UPI003327450A